MTTTQPQVQSSNVKECGNINIPDYTILRQQNLDKINEYYNSLLASYNKNYRDYNAQNISSNINDRIYENTTFILKVKCGILLNSSNIEQLSIRFLLLTSA